MNRIILTAVAASVAAFALAAQSAHAGKLLISEVCYDEVGSTLDGEWVEIYNGSDTLIDLSNYKIGDEETKGATSATEGMFQFPEGASIAPGEVQIVSSYASRFKSVYGFAPTYEVGNFAPTANDPKWVDDSAVANMREYLTWDPDGAKLNMANTNDQILFLDDSDNAVDFANWGNTFFFSPGLVADQASGQSYERVDVNVDTDTAADWQLGTNPGNVSWTSQSSPGTLFVPTISTWIADGDGAWTIDPNWQDSRIPDGKGQTAILADVLTDHRTILLSGPITIGSLSAQSSFGYTIAGTHTLTFDRGSGSVTIETTKGDNRIETPVTFARNATLTVDAGSSLTLAGPVTSPTVAITKAGDGMLTMPGVRATALTVNGGTLAIGTAANAADGTTRVAKLTVATGAHLDLNGNALIVDYSADANPLATLGTEVADGRITSAELAANPSLTIGLLDTGAAASPVTSFGGLDVTGATAILGAVTYKGDFNLDHSVAFADLLTLAKHYGMTSGGNWQGGDTDYDGDVDFNDLLALAKNYNKGAADASLPADFGGSAFAADWALAQSLAPEPATLGALLGMGALATARRRR